MLIQISNKEVHGPTFSVAVPNIHQVRYKEGSRVAVVEIEGGMEEGGEVNWLLYQETLKGWEPPHEMEEMSENKRAEVLSNVSQSLTILEMPHELV
jgi:hypothetical protein